MWRSPVRESRDVDDGAENYCAFQMREKPWVRRTFKLGDLVRVPNENVWPAEASG